MRARGWCRGASRGAEVSHCLGIWPGFSDAAFGAWRSDLKPFLLPHWRPFETLALRQDPGPTCHLVLEAPKQQPCPGPGVCVAGPPAPGPLWSPPPLVGFLEGNGPVRPSAAQGIQRVGRGGRCPARSPSQHRRGLEAPPSVSEPTGHRGGEAGAPWSHDQRDSNLCCGPASVDPVQPGQSAASCPQDLSTLASPPGAHSHCPRARGGFALASAGGAGGASSLGAGGGWGQTSRSPGSISLSLCPPGGPDLCPQTSLASTTKTPPLLCVEGVGGPPPAGPRFQVCSGMSPGPQGRMPRPLAPG